MGFFGTQLGHLLLNIKWSHIQHNKNQHVKMYTLSDFTLQSKQKTFLKRLLLRNLYWPENRIYLGMNNDLIISLPTRVDMFKTLGPRAPKSRKGNVRRICGGPRSYLKS